MIRRCDDHRDARYKDYGGRGIKYPKKWKDFSGFLEDMSDSFSEGLLLDRIDNNGSYSKENCRWATRKQQQRNTRTNKIIEYQGEKKCLAEWAESLGMNKSTLAKRLNRSNWDIEKAISKKVSERVNDGVALKGKRMTITYWAKVTGLNVTTISNRLKRGWSVEEALTRQT